MEACWALVFAVLVGIAPPVERGALARGDDAPQGRGHLTVTVYSTTPCLAVAGANVLISRRWQAKTDEFGVARFERLPAGRHEMTVSSFGHRDLHGSVEVFEARTTSVVCDVASDEPCRDVS